MQQAQLQEQQVQNPASFDEYRRELWGAQKVSHEQYDKAILTLSAGGLAISLSLVKDLFPAEKMILPFALVTSWGLFCGSIILTVISFLTSLKSISVQLDHFEKYIAGDVSYWNRKNVYITITTWLNRASGIAFILAVIAMTAFSATNFRERLRDVQKRQTSRGIRSSADALSQRNSDGGVEPISGGPSSGQAQFSLNSVPVKTVERK